MFFNPKIHTISKSAIVPHKTQAMFDLVNKIPDYPKFLNWCIKGSILSQTPNKIIASLMINKGGFSQSFTTINQLSSTKKQKRIDMLLKDGPFKQLTGVWLFQEIDPYSCKINFDINFSFDNKLIDLTLSPVFSQIANTQLDAFIVRANHLYGK